MFRRIVLLALGVLTAACLGGARLQAQQNAQQTEPRIAFVVGNAAYAPGALPATLNDAGLVAEALRSIGFEIIEGADLSQSDLVRTYREFLAKVEASGPDTLAFVYFSGHALSFEGENYLLGVDARLPRDSDIPIEGVRLSDLMRPLADSPARAKVVMIDAMRPLPFRPQGKGLARGLEAIDPPQSVLIAYASAPGTVAPDQPGNYGPYATAIAEMLRAPGTDLETIFTHIRSRTHLTTEGRQTPWHASAVGEQIELLPPEAATASAPPPPPIRQARPMREIGADEAYALAIEMDTLEGYTGFVQAYPGHPYSKRVWAMIRARREALAWMRALEINSPQSYWTYLRRYPNGMYASDAERRLRRLGVAGGPPPGFAMMEFDDVPMALSGEPVEYEEVYRVGPPPPRGLYGAPRPAYLANLPPPERRGGSGAGSRILPALAIAIPLAAALAPAPRRAVAPDAPGAGGGNRQGGSGWRGGNRNAPGAAAPVSVTPSQPVAPAATAPAPAIPNPAIAPSTVTPSTATPGATPPATPGGTRPPGWGPGGTRPPGVAGRPPGGGAPGGAVAPNTATPNTAAPNTAAPSTAAPGTAAPSAAVTPNAVAPKPMAPNSAAPNAAPGNATPSTASPGNTTPPPAGPPAPGFRRPPGGGPPPGIANRTPPAAPPAAAPSSAAPNPAAAPTPPAAGRPPGRPPGPPPGIANRTPPSAAPPQSAAPPARPPGPPPQVNRPPPPPPQVNRSPPPPPPAVARPAPPAAPVAAPPPRPAPPPAAAAAAKPPAPPPPRPAAAAPPPKPPACPAGKTLKVVNGAPTCA
jgi:Caspase domain